MGNIKKFLYIFPWEGLVVTSVYTVAGSVFLSLQGMESYAVVSILELFVVSGGILIAGLLWVWTFFQLRNCWYTSIEIKKKPVSPEFISIAVHKIRTPLTGIKWFLELLLKEDLSPVVRDYVNQIAVSNDRITQLADDLLDVSHIETGRKFEFNLKKIDVMDIAKQILATQKLLAKMRKVSMKIDSRCPKKLIIEVDADKIKKVFQNILNNAMKYSRVGGVVETGCEKKEGAVTWYVKDFGIGIPKNQQSRIFEKFFRADNASASHIDGTGLGLYICKAIIDGHGGNIWFESEEGKGSTFYFSLPIASKSKK